MSTQVLTTRANGPPGQQDEEGRQCITGIPTGTVLGKTDDGILSTAVEELRTALGLVDTDEADVLGISRLWIAVDDIPASSGGDVTQRVGGSGILMRYVVRH